MSDPLNIPALVNEALADGLRAEVLRLQGRVTELEAINFRILSDHSALQQLREENAKLQASNRALDNHNEELLQENDRLDALVNELEEEGDRLIGKLKDENERLKGELSTLDQRMGDRFDSILRRDEEIQKLQARLNWLNALKQE